jgi:hypothetical protein
MEMPTGFLGNFISGVFFTSICRHILDVFKIWRKQQALYVNQHLSKFQRLVDINSNTNHFLSVEHNLNDPRT